MGFQDRVYETQLARSARNKVEKTLGARPVRGRNAQRPAQLSQDRGLPPAGEAGSRAARSWCCVGSQS